MDSTALLNVRCSAIVFRRDRVLLLRRTRDGEPDWVLPGGTPRPGEPVVSCVRREVREETGLLIGADRVAFVLEASNIVEGLHLLDLVFTTSEVDASISPGANEPGLTPVFYPVAEIAKLPLRPPIAGHLRALHARGGQGEGLVLGNLWRPAGRAGEADRW